MIRYQLVCDREHGFDAWFSDSQAFENQKAKGLLSCPACGSERVDRALMAPAVSLGKAERRQAKDEARPVFAADPGAAEVKGALRKLREHVVANSDYVGDRFAEEARKIHYREAEQRGIYGETTADEARALAEEGVEFHPLPVLPEDQN